MSELMSIIKKAFGTIMVFIGGYMIFAFAFSCYQNILAYIYEMKRLEYSYTSITFLVGMGVLLLFSILLIYNGSNLLKRWKTVLGISLMSCGVWAFLLFFKSKEILSSKIGNELAFYSAKSIGDLVAGIFFLIIGLILFFYGCKQKYTLSKIDQR